MKTLSSRKLAANRASAEALKLLVFGLVVASRAFADSVIDLNFEFSGGTAPAGRAPWITATFKDLAGGGVELTIANSGLVDSEFVSEFAFNLNPDLNSRLFLPIATGTGTQTDYDVISAGNDAFKADGDGFFDYVIVFPKREPQRFGAGETFVVRVGAGNSIITSADFLFPSVNGPAAKNGFLVAAHVQSIGRNRGAGWVTGELQQDTCIDATVPEPSPIVPLGTLLIGA